VSRFFGFHAFTAPSSLLLTVTPGRDFVRHFLDTRVLIRVLTVSIHHNACREVIGKRRAEVTVWQPERREDALRFPEPHSKERIFRYESVIAVVRNPIHSWQYQHSGFEFGAREYVSQVIQHAMWFTRSHKLKARQRCTRSRTHLFSLEREDSPENAIGGRRIDAVGSRELGLDSVLQPNQQIFPFAPLCIRVREIGESLLPLSYHTDSSTAVMLLRTL
jgi:hypothetical protein